MMKQLWEKIDWLVEDPIPDGKLKKKLQVNKDLYRLRVGDYRVIYTFGDGWISLLGIRPRKDGYKDVPQYEKAGHIPEIDFDDSDLEEEINRPKIFSEKWSSRKEEKRETPLPYIISEIWLTELKIPPGYHELLVKCKTEEELFDTPIPEEMILRVHENIMYVPINDVLAQPDLAVFDTKDLIRYKEGDLLGFLLRMDSEQERLVDWALEGPTLIKGGPGTGKSTVALYRIRSILEKAQREGKPYPKILFTTYTNALIRFSQQLLEQLLGDKVEHVKVATEGSIA